MTLSELLPEDLAWCTRRIPKSLKWLMMLHPGKLMLAGGFIRSCIANEPVNDLDFFVPDKPFARQLVDTLAEKSKADIYITDNAISITESGVQVQFITRWTFDNPHALIQSFDFTVAKAAIWADPDNRAQWRSAIDPRFYPDLAAKRLVYCSPVREEEAGGSMLRVLKFYRQGYRIPLNSLGAVMARMACKLDVNKMPNHDGESQAEAVARVLTGMLVEVDPNSIMASQAYFADAEKAAEAHTGQ